LIRAYHGINAVLAQFPVKVRKYQRDKGLQENVWGIILPRVVFFEFLVNDPKRAIAFYEKVVGWTVAKWEPFDYWLIATRSDDEPGINGAIIPRTMRRLVTVDTTSVESIDDLTRKTVEAGETVMIPKQAVPGQYISPTARARKETYFASSRWTRLRNSGDWLEALC